MAGSDGLGEPTVIVDDVHLTYRITGRPAKSGGGAAALSRILARKERPVLREVRAVRGVSLVAHRGEAVGLVGPNGSGKSTLLRGIAGLLPPESGAIYTAGQPSLLGVGAALMNTMTGERNITLGCLAMGMTPKEVKELYEPICEFAGIGEFITLPMNAYSSGMGARLRFSIAASKVHDVLLIDEALATGDAEFRRRSEERILELRKAAGTVFVVSHSLGVVRDTCERAIWLEQGKVVMDADSETVVDAYLQRHDPKAAEKHRLAAAREREAAATRERESENVRAKDAAREADPTSLAEVAAAGGV